MRAEIAGSRGGLPPWQGLGDSVPDGEFGSSRFSSGTEFLLGALPPVPRQRVIDPLDSRLTGGSFARDRTECFFADRTGFRLRVDIAGSRGGLPPWQGFGDSVPDGEFGSSVFHLGLRRVGLRDLRVPPLLRGLGGLALQANESRPRGLVAVHLAQELATLLAVPDLGEGLFAEVPERHLAAPVVAAGDDVAAIENARHLHGPDGVASLDRLEAHRRHPADVSGARHRLLEVLDPLEPQPAPVAHRLAGLFPAEVALVADNLDINVVGALEFDRFAAEILHETAEAAGGVEVLEPHQLLVGVVVEGVHREAEPVELRLEQAVAQLAEKHPVGEEVHGGARVAALGQVDAFDEFRVAQRLVHQVHQDAEHLAVGGEFVDHPLEEGVVHLSQGDLVLDLGMGAERAGGVAGRGGLQHHVQGEGRGGKLAHGVSFSGGGRRASPERNSSSRARSAAGPAGPSAPSRSATRRLCIRLSHIR